MKTQNLFGLNICSGSLDEAVVEIVDHCKIGSQLKIVSTPNTDHILKLETSHSEFKDNYSKSDWLFPDGMPLVWASKLLGKPLASRITGSDLVPALLKAASQNNLSVAVIATTDELLDKFIVYCKSNYSDLKVVYGTSVSFPFNPVGEEASNIAKDINISKADIVLIGLGFPKQEQWLFNYKVNSTVKVGVGIGAALEFLVGEKQRPSLWMQNMGLEWLGRLVSEPKRLAPRYASNLYFVIIVISEILSTYIKKQGEINVK